MLDQGSDEKIWKSRERKLVVVYPLSILIVFRGAGFVYNDWLAQYEDTEFYVTKNIKLWTGVVWSNGRMKVWSGIVGSSVRVWVRAVVRSD